jgi:hypothetical protein
MYMAFWWNNIELLAGALLSDNVHYHILLNGTRKVESFSCIP